jgi:hypothetical protein
VGVLSNDALNSGVRFSFATTVKRARRFFIFEV